MMLLGISGKAGVGKTTLARGMAEHFQHCNIVSFADDLRAEVSLRLNVPIKWLKEKKDKTVEGKTLRNHLIEYGAWRRSQNPDYWVNALAQNIDPEVPTIIDDVRFPNEARWILSQGGRLIRLNPYPRWTPIVPVDNPSECALDEWLNWSLELNPLQDEQAALAKNVACWWHAAMTTEEL